MAGRRPAVVPASPRPTREEAEEAVRTLIRWARDDPEREGLRDTPARVVRAYEEFFQGYLQEPTEILSRTFSEVGGYDEMIVMTDIRFESHCEHHMVPIIGKAHVGYLPDKRVVGISKLARLVEIYARNMRGDYLQSLAEFQRLYREECSKAGIDYVAMDTSVSFDKALMEYLLLGRIG